MFARLVLAIVVGVRLLLRDVWYRLGAERRRQHLRELDQYLARVRAGWLTFDEAIAQAHGLGHRRVARTLEALRRTRASRELDRWSQGDDGRGLLPPSQN
jgi:hypothetical protein